MQYLYQKQSGERVRLNESQANLAMLDPCFYRRIATPMITVFAARKHMRLMQHEERLHYGGRNRGGDYRQWNGA